MSSMHMAIEFAKHLLRGTISNKRMARKGEETQGEEYHPKEFKLLLAQLEHNGEEVFKEWVGSVFDDVWEEIPGTSFDSNSTEAKDYIEKAIKQYKSLPENVRKVIDNDRLYMNSPKAAERLQQTKDKLNNL